MYFPGAHYVIQGKIFRRKRLTTGANFVYVYIEIWNNGILKFNKSSMLQVKKEQQCDPLMFAFIKLYEIS